jgi:ubiquinone/menaquinone biosynthesis C-methylase UbiE
MGFYEEWIVPPLIDWSMRNKRLRPYRERTAGAAEGRVLDIGIGSGLNLPFYARQAREIFGLDPSPPLLARAQSMAPRTQTPIHLLEGSAERIPLADHTIDTVVMTWTGCSIPEICAALEEMRRVLRPGGRLLFVEHGRAPEPRVARWQESSRSVLAAIFRRVPPEPQNRRSAFECGLSDRSSGNGLHPRTKDYDVLL